MGSVPVTEPHNGGRRRLGWRRARYECISYIGTVIHSVGMHENDDHSGQAGTKKPHIAPLNHHSVASRSSHLPPFSAAWPRWLSNATQSSLLGDAHPQIMAGYKRTQAFAASTVMIINLPSSNSSSQHRPEPQQFCCEATTCLPCLPRLLAF